MKRPGHRTIRQTGLARAAVLVAVLAAPATARAEMLIPVTVRITKLVQLDHDQDPGAVGIGQSLGDLYAVVVIDGTSFDSFDDRCDNPPPDLPEQSVFDTPYVFFDEEGNVDPSCRNVPWTFVKDVPISRLQFDPVGIPVRIRILDSDSGFGGDDDLLEDFTLNLPLGSRWSGAVDWPEHCRSGTKADVCWQMETGHDSDGDGLPDDWEINGIDVDGNGTADLKLQDLGANPLHKDIFVELDWRPGFEPQRAGVRRWKEAFAAAPVDAGGVPNPDGLPGITLHVDTGGLTENGLLVGDNLGGGNALSADFPVCSLSRDAGAFYPAKAANFNAALRGLAFRYGITSTQCCIFGTSRGTPCQIDAQCPGAICQPKGGQAEIGGNDFVVWNTGFQDSTLMHELGHTLNLRHGGDVDDNCKPDYVSIMNYDHFEIQRLDGSRVIDYSPPRQPNGARGTAPLPPLAEDDLDETQVLDPADPQHFLVYTDPTRTKRLALVGAPVDWRGNGNATETHVTVNVDNSDASGNPELCTNAIIRTAADPLTGYDDWRAVSLPFLQFGESADGPINPVDTPEPTDTQLLAHRQLLNTADLAITKSGPAGPVEAGATADLAYTLAFANQGPNPAVKVRVYDVLPPGATVLAADTGCAETAGGTVTCDLPALLPGGSSSVALSVRATARCAGGVPTAIANTATVTNAFDFAGPDPDGTDDTAVAETAVVDTTPPTLSLTGSVPALWPPNHKYVPVTVTVVSTDVCDDSPTIRLVSVVSNEPTDAKGSGNTVPDVQDAAFGTDDRLFQIRAERTGKGDGRSYTITYEAEDGSGNVTRSAVVVSVPKQK